MTPEQQRAIAIARARSRVQAQPAGNPPPAGMSAQEAAEAAMSGALADRRLDRAREAPLAVRAGASVLQGLPFVGEYVDEAVAPLGVTDDLRAIQEANAIDAPVMNTVGQVAGGVLGSVPLAMAAGPAMLARAPASLAGRVLTGTAAGATVGGVEGAVSGYGAGNDGDRAADATERGLIGAGLGAGLGAFAPVASFGASSMVRNIRGRPDAAAARRLGGSPESAEVVGRMLANDDPAQVAGRIAAGGDRAMVGDAGPATAGLLDTAIQRAGPGGTIARDAIEGRASAATADMTDALDRFLGRPQGIREAGRNIARSSSALRQRAYDAAYAKPINYADATGMKVEETLSRIPGRLMNDAIRDANEEMVSRGLQNEQIIARIADDGRVAFDNMPNVRQLDAIKQALDKLGAEVDIFGRPTAAALRPRRLARELGEAVKEAVPEYRRAVALGGQKIKEDQALDIGRRILNSNTTREDVADQLAGASAAELRQARTGLRQQIDEAMANVRRAVTDSNMEAREGLAVLRSLSSRASREKIRTVLGDGPADALLKRVDEAAKAFELRARTAENSRTFARQNMDEAISELTQPGMIGELLSGSPVQATRKLVQSMTNMTPQARRAVEERITGEIATMLTQRTGPDAQRAAAQLVQMLERAPITESLARRIGQATGATVAVGGYQTGTRSLGTQ